MELFIRFVLVTLCLWGIVAIVGVTLPFWSLVGVGALVTVGLRLATSEVE